MADQWQSGDVALCVDDRPADEEHDCQIKAGESYTVMSVIAPGVIALTPYGRGPCSSLCLLEAGNPDAPDGAYDARRFQKQPTLLKEDERVTETTAP